MTTYTASLPAQNGAGNEAIAMASVEAAMTALGFTRTADTGQSTTTYSVWAFADALQSTAPLVLKLIYYVGAGNTAGTFGAQLGTGSNGAGTITGLLGSSQITGSQTAVAAASTLYASSNGSNLVVFTIGGGAPSSILIERSCDASGTPTGAGVLLAWGGYNGNPSWTVVPLAAPSQALSWPAEGPLSLPSGATAATGAGYSSHAPVLPFLAYAPGVPAWVVKSALGVLPADMAAVAPVAITTAYGTHTYMRPSASTLTGATTLSAASACGFLIAAGISGAGSTTSLRYYPPILWE